MASERRVQRQPDRVAERQAAPPHQERGRPDREHGRDGHTGAPLDHVGAGGSLGPASPSQHHEQREGHRHRGRRRNLADGERQEPQHRAHAEPTDERPAATLERDDTRPQAPRRGGEGRNVAHEASRERRVDRTDEEACECRQRARRGNNRRSSAYKQQQPAPPRTATEAWSAPIRVPKTFTTGTTIASWPTSVWVFQSSSWRWPVRVHENRMRLNAQSSFRGIPRAPKCQMITSGNATLRIATAVKSTTHSPRGPDAHSRT